MRDGTHAFFRYKAFFTILRAFKTEILHIYSLIGQILIKTIIPLSIDDQRWISTASHLHFGG